MVRGQPTKGVQVKVELARQLKLPARGVLQQTSSYQWKCISYVVLLKRSELLMRLCVHFGRRPILSALARKRGELTISLALPDSRPRTITTLASRIMSNFLKTGKKIVAIGR